MRKSENPFWNGDLPMKKPTFKEIQDAVKKALEAQEKIKLPCGCIPQDGFTIGCGAHSLIDEVENEGC